MAQHVKRSMKMKAKTVGSLFTYSATFLFGGHVEITFDDSQVWDVDIVVPDYYDMYYVLKHDNVQMSLPADVFERDFEVIEE